MHDLIVDSFAGGGGASLGITWALGRHPDVAINHDPAAILMHRTNHPTTRHLTEDIWSIYPRTLKTDRSDFSGRVLTADISHGPKDLNRLRKIFGDLSGRSPNSPPLSNLQR